MTQRNREAGGEGKAWKAGDRVAFSRVSGGSAFYPKDRKLHPSTIAVRDRGTIRDLNQGVALVECESGLHVVALLGCRRLVKRKAQVWEGEWERDSFCTMKFVAPYDILRIGKRAILVEARTKAMNPGPRPEKE